MCDPTTALKTRTHRLKEAIFRERLELSAGYSSENVLSVFLVQLTEIY